MGAWPDLATARLDLRRFLNDGPKDRFIKQKGIAPVGAIDGANTTFFTFEDRLVVGTLVVFVNGAVASGVTLVDAVQGQFTVTPAPAAQSTIRASYFFQYFLDEDLDEALDLATGELNETSDITLVPLGLKGAALNFSAYFAISKQVIRWSQRKSAQFQLEEEPIQQEPTNRSDLFERTAERFYKKAVEMRTSYYTRHGRRNAPAFNVYKPVIRQIAPRR